MDRIHPLPDGPGSVRTVAQALRGGGLLTSKELQERSGLARRTVYSALRRLLEMGYVERHPNLRDTRRSWFVLRDG